jgi:hypothetical protein
VSPPAHTRFVRNSERVLALPRRLRVPLLVAMAALVGGLQLAVPSPAAAISGLQRTAGFSESGTAPAKVAKAYCPEGKRVLGGGGLIYDGGRNQVRLTALEPIHYLDPGEVDWFEVYAQAPYLADSFSWKLAAYAVCADSSALSRYEIVRHWNEPSSYSFQTAAARCPSGTVAYGSGASVLDAKGRVGLQLNRTSGPLDISRAAARDDSGPFFGQWTLESAAVCAEPRGAIHAEGQSAPGAEATDTCNSGFHTHGPGGGGGLTDGGPVWLKKIYPRNDLRGVDVALTGPLYPSIGGMVAHQTCGL